MVKIGSSTSGSARLPVGGKSKSSDASSSSAGFADALRRQSSNFVSGISNSGFDSEERSGGYIDMTEAEPDAKRRKPAIYGFVGQKALVSALRMAGANDADALAISERLLTSDRNIKVIMVENTESDPDVSDVVRIGDFIYMPESIYDSWTSRTMGNGAKDALMKRLGDLVH